MHARTAARLARATYARLEDVPAVLPQGWHHYERITPKTGFGLQVDVFISADGQDKVLAIRGTVGLLDFCNDVLLAFRRRPWSEYEARKVVQEHGGHASQYDITAGAQQLQQALPAIGREAEAALVAMGSTAKTLALDASFRMLLAAIAAALSISFGLPALCAVSTAVWQGVVKSLEAQLRAASAALPSTVRPLLAAIDAQVPGRRTVLVGHSLGGCIAQLMAGHFDLPAGEVCVYVCGLIR